MGMKTQDLEGPDELDCYQKSAREGKAARREKGRKNNKKRGKKRKGLRKEEKRIKKKKREEKRKGSKVGRGGERENRSGVGVHRIS